VRRSTDNAEQGFTSTEVSDGTLAAWCGGGDGFVKTWHDQSQHGRDATAATAQNEPKIVASGVVITDGGKPALQFDGANDYLSFTPISSLHPWTVVEVKRRPTAGTHGPILGTTQAGGMYAHWQFTDNIAYARNRDSGFMTFGAVANEQIAVFAVSPTAAKTDIQVYRNAVGLAGSVGAGGVSTADFDAIGRTGSAYSNGFYQELLIYPTDMTALRTRIEGDLAWYY